jgi:hypothetical protein
MAQNEINNSPRHWLKQAETILVQLHHVRSPSPSNTSERSQSLVLIGRSGTGTLNTIHSSSVFSGSARATAQVWRPPCARPKPRLLPATASSTAHGEAVSAREVGGPYRSDILYIFFAISSRKFKCIAFILHCRSRKLQIYNITNDHYRRPTNFSLLNSQISQFIKIICMLNHK